ncbi:MAG: FAD-dependent oxidoreductase, partial [Firmicutes bacterium]|nr:FAD-dependent oxidoreductase [Bacillota bacterium]
SIRQGAVSVTQLEMMPKSPDTRAESNPWPQWPLVCKVDYGQEEAIAKFGHDPRIYQTTVKEIRKDESGAISSVITVSLEAKRDPNTGRNNMVPIEGSEQEMPCELLLIAAGFLGCENYVAEAFGVGKTPRGALATDAGSYKTNVPGIFAAGDAHRGQSLVVWAISEGSGAAKEADEYLMGYTNII